jgi:intron-binding protein aquarius
VDQYQGQQNNIILLSLVRTGPTVGHIRDIRRLIVAVSRARLGLYVFCRFNVFRNVYDVQRVLELISQHSNESRKLQLVVGEQHPTERQIGDPVADEQVYEVDDVIHMGAIVHQMQETMLQDVS